MLIDGLFNNALSFMRIWEKVVMAYFMVLSHNLLLMTWECDSKLQSL
jgi:hypothetical protein